MSHSGDSRGARCGVHMGQQPSAQWERRILQVQKNVRRLVTTAIVTVLVAGFGTASASAGTTVHDPRAIVYFSGPHGTVKFDNSRSRNDGATCYEWYVGSSAKTVCVKPGRTTTRSFNVPSNGGPVIVTTEGGSVVQAVGASSCFHNTWKSKRTPCTGISSTRRGTVHFWGDNSRARSWTTYFTVDRANTNGNVKVMYENPVKAGKTVHKRWTSQTNGAAFTTGRYHKKNGQWYFLTWIVVPGGEEVSA